MLFQRAAIASESKRFTSRDDAVARTVRGLRQAGFTVRNDVSEMDGVRVGTYTHQPSDRTKRNKPPMIAALYTDPATGNRVSLGMNIAEGGNVVWPYNWYGRATGADEQILDQGGNHDNSPLELLDQLTSLMGHAHFDAGESHLATHSAEFQRWAAGLAMQLDPIYSDSIRN